jgi:hypothetical protein
VLSFRTTIGCSVSNMSTMGTVSISRTPGEHLMNQKLGS